jgi:hypothetical protein
VREKLTCLALGVIFGLGASAKADTITLGSWGFSNITNNNATSAKIGEAQLTVDLLREVGDSTHVEFLFKNTGLYASSIADVYFDDGTDQSLCKIDSFNESSGVKFSKDARPRKLPGGDLLSPKFQVTPGLSADSDSPVQSNGVNPGEWLGIVLNLATGKTWENVLGDLMKGDLRVGIHVQGFSEGCSESFVNTLSPPGGETEVPAPSALVALVGIGALGVFRVRRPARRRPKP